MSVGALSLSLLGACGQSHGAESDAGATPDAPIDAPSTAVDAWSAIDASIVEVDGGSTPDVGPSQDAAPSSCEGLAPAACLAAGCAPDFDDSCCPNCTVGGCADCVHFVYESCQPMSAGCADDATCGVTPAWSCSFIAPSCDDAHAVAIDSCDRLGCVPAYPSGLGEPDPSSATCVPITASSCTVGCRLAPPDCPTGTTAEGDGTCYTGVCIPAFVCD